MMPSRSLTVTKVFRRNGRAYIRFSDKLEKEFASLAEAKEYAQSVVDDLEFLRKLAMCRYFQVDPNATNPNLIEGRTITVTNESNNMVVVS